MTAQHAVRAVPSDYAFTPNFTIEGYAEPSPRAAGSTTSDKLAAPRVAELRTYGAASGTTITTTSDDHTS